VSGDTELSPRLLQEMALAAVHTHVGHFVVAAATTRLYNLHRQVPADSEQRIEGHGYVVVLTHTDIQWVFTNVVEEGDTLTVETVDSMGTERWVYRRGGREERIRDAMNGRNISFWHSIYQRLRSYLIDQGIALTANFETP
jgi:hypothetical protein